jgi:hypothetical protein
MKQFLLGVVCGILIVLVLGLSQLFIPHAYADDGDNLKYKQYLSQMLRAMKEVNSHLAAIEENTRAVKEKLHA